MTKEEFEYLSKYEGNFSTAVNDDYSRNVQRNALERMKKIYDRNRKTNYPLSYGCGACQLRFLKIIGRMFFEEKARRVAKGL